MSKNLIPSLNALLSNVRKIKNFTGVEHDSQLFSNSELEEFLSLAEQSTKTVLKTQDIFGHTDLVIEYAFYLALMSRSLLEKGREYQTLDNGIHLSPPDLSNHMVVVASNVINNWFRKLYAML